MNLSLLEVARVLNAQNDLSAYEDLPLVKVEFDSRLVTAGDLFVPLKGERDGHDFIPMAFDKGALVTLSERPLEVPHILVADCLQALQELAAYYLDKTGVEVIAVTGSNGKTTTKDMLHAVLSRSFQTYKTQGNYNNDIGLPYTVLHMPEGTEKLVLEMGQDHFGDIHRLSMLARPAVGVITLFGEAHLAFFDSQKDIAKGKLQLADGMAKGNLLLLPADPVADDLLPDHLNLVRFGSGADLEVTELVTEKNRLTFKVNFMEQAITLPVTGHYNATNAMLAAYVAKTLGVAEADIVSALADLVLTKNRTEWKKAKNGADILSDVYNANPTAMKLVLETFASLPKPASGRKVVVLADMKELGEQSIALHSQLMAYLSPDAFDRVYCYGEDIKDLAEEAMKHFPAGAVSYFEKSAQKDEFDLLSASLLQTIEPTDQLLFKGSNSMNLAKLVDRLVGEDQGRETC